KELSQMPHRTRRAGLAGATILVLVGLVPAACGGSSKPTTNAAAATTTPGTVRAVGAGSFRALRTCLAKNGITLPQRPARPGAGARRQGGGGSIFGGGGGATGRAPQLPAGATAAQFQAALKKCGVADGF